MCTSKNYFVLLVMALLMFQGITYAQITHVVTLHVDPEYLDQGNNKKAYSFTVSDETETENEDDPETFTIIVNEEDEIAWEGVTKEGEAIDIEAIIIEDDVDNPHRRNIFRSRKLNGRRGQDHPRKKVKGKVKKNTKGNTYKYIIQFSLEGNTYEIDPKIRV
ncbi:MULTISPECIES: hypothetical protein [Arenibacter]|uniref:hypothetical protein n=1 Tax=Arenibacter TaxID=178469 RepID=UPI000A3CF04C|nr:MULTISPECIES: hypothetical protein [Arenibacter]